MCSLWVSYRKRCMRQFIVSYNNSFRILRSLPMRCSASAMFASSNVDSCQARIIQDLTRFNKIATQGAPQMAVDKEANSLSRVYSYYSKFNLRLFYV